jgi:hypothetical protein
METIKVANDESPTLKVLRLRPYLGPDVHGGKMTDFFQGTN